jgi:SAM-dependent methyltransferase
LAPFLTAINTHRGIRTYLTTAELLPFPDGAFHGVLMALALCFVSDAEQAMHECARVLHSLGMLVIGMIPADGPWGKVYMRKALEGHPVYSLARFRAASEVLTLAADAGLEIRASASAILWEPDSDRIGDARVERGISQEAAFLGLLFGKADTTPARFKVSEHFA